MNPPTPHTTIPAPGPGQDTTFTLEVWQEHDMPPILHLAEGWTRIEDQAFVDHPDLEEIHIPTSVVSIHEDAFNGAINLRQVEFAQSSMLNGPRLFFGDGVFAATEALKRINIPARATDIGDRAFLGATGLEEITFEEGSKIEVIGFQTFESATALQTIRIPARVKEISVEAFRNASSLVEVAFEEGSKLEFIGDNAFDGATALQTIHIPSGVGYIGQGAFRNTMSLQTIRIPRLVDTIMDLTFENATSLREVTFEGFSMLQTIAPGAFLGTTSLQTIQIPAEVTRIGEAAFRGATALQTIEIPAGLMEIGEAAFANTTSLSEITFKQYSQITRIHQNAFIESGLTIVYIGSTALDRLNGERATQLLSPLLFNTDDNNFYGKPGVKIISRAEQINMFMRIGKKQRYKTQRNLFGKVKEKVKAFLGKPTKKLQPVPIDLARMVAATIAQKKPKSGNNLSPTAFARRVAQAHRREIHAANARLAAMDAEEAAGAGAKAEKVGKGGARKSRRRKRGARRTQKRRRRTMKRK